MCCPEETGRHCTCLWPRARGGHAWCSAARTGAPGEMAESRVRMRLTWGDGVERVTGIEPALSAWEADVLPLNYTRGRRPG